LQTNQRETLHKQTTNHFTLTINWWIQNKYPTCHAMSNITTKESKQAWLGGYQNID